MDETLQAWLTPEALSQYLLIHDKLASIQLQVGIPDTVVWRLTGDGQYSAIPAYAIQFEGAVRRLSRTLSGVARRLSNAGYSPGLPSLASATHLIV
jgi:hypothetical protein